MPQVDVGKGTHTEGEFGMRREQRFQGHVERQALGREPPGQAGLSRRRQGRELVSPSPRWLVLSRLRELSSWLPW